MGTAEAVGFEAIFKTANKSRLQPIYDEKGINPLQEEKPAQKRRTQPRNSIPEARTRIEREAERRRREQERYQNGIQEQQDAIKRSGNLRSEILKGIRQGEDTTGLLLKACECISLQTGDKLFYSQAEKDVRSIYGYGLGDMYPLQLDLSDTQARLIRLLQAEERETDADVKRRLHGAITAHRQRIEQINESLRK